MKCDKCGRKAVARVVGYDMAVASSSEYESCMIPASESHHGNEFYIHKKADTDEE